MRWGNFARHNSPTNAEKAVCEPSASLWGHSAKGGVRLQSKGGVDLQGCGQIAKVGMIRKDRPQNAKVGSKRKRTAEAVLCDQILTP